MPLSPADKQSEFLRVWFLRSRSLESIINVFLFPESQAVCTKENKGNDAIDCELLLGLLLVIFQRLIGLQRKDFCASVFLIRKLIADFE